MATIDVLLPVRNGVSFLCESIDSIRNQTFSDWRLLILDHGSTDGSRELACRYADNDKRINVFSFPKADGLAGLLNAGLEKCDCRYVMRQDADDISLPARMATTADMFEQNPELLVVGGDATLIDSEGRQIGHLRMPTSPAAVAAASLFYNPILHPTVTLNFPALRPFGGPYGKDILNAVPASQSFRVRGLAEDYILFGQLVLLGPCANAGVPLIRYRRHSASVGITNPAAQLELALQISRFLAKSFCVMKGVEAFDPGPFCNHADYVFDFQLKDYSFQYAQMADALRRGLGPSDELERELAFRWVLATRNSRKMVRQYMNFAIRYGMAPTERRTVRNWVLRNIRKGKYVYRANIRVPEGENASECIS
jgi:glycosyltransferase involved in cell wall biosynthesis